MSCPGPQGAVPPAQVGTAPFATPILPRPRFPWYDQGKWKFMCALLQMAMEKSSDLTQFPYYLDGLVSAFIDMTFEAITPAQVNDMLSKKAFCFQPRSAPPCAFFRSIAKCPHYNLQDIAKAFSVLSNLFYNAPAIIPADLPPPFLISFTPDGKTLSVFETSSVTLSRKQILLILFVATLGGMNNINPPECPNMVQAFSVWNLLVNTELAESGYVAAHCLMAYFIRSADPALGVPFWDEPVNFLRKQVVRKISWENLACPFCNIRTYLDKTPLDDSTAQFKADFANKFVGGGVLNRGCAQEEMFFCSAPECLAAIIFCPPVNDNESLCFSGVRIFSQQQGYSYSRTFAGFSTPEKYMKRHTVFTLDALELPRTGSRNLQFQEASVTREIQKAYSGFSFATPGTDIATGNWGSGAFRGDVELKFIEQWIAASALGIELVHYYAYGHESLQNLPKVIEGIKGLYPNVGVLYQTLMKICAHQNGPLRFPEDGPSNLFKMLLMGPQRIDQMIAPQQPQQYPQQYPQQQGPFVPSPGPMPPQQQVPFVPSPGPMPPQQQGPFVPGGNPRPGRHTDMSQQQPSRPQQQLYRSQPSQSQQRMYPSEPQKTLYSSSPPLQQPHGTFTPFDKQSGGPKYPTQQQQPQQYYPPQQGSFTPMGPGGALPPAQPQPPAGFVPFNQQQGAAGQPPQQYYPPGGNPGSSRSDF